MYFDAHSHLTFAFCLPSVLLETSSFRYLVIDSPFWWEKQREWLL